MRIRHPFPRARRPSRSIPSLLALGATALVVAACGSSSPGNSHKSSPGPSKTTAGNSHASVLTTKVSGYGTVLANAHGAPLYLLSADPSGGSSCRGSCAKQWPPLTVSGQPSAGSGVDRSLLSTFTRSDGTKQVLYDGHALYTHPGLSASAVAGTAADGGIWYLVSPSGKPIKSTNGSGY